MKRLLFFLTTTICLLAACSPTETVVQTAIAQTQTAAPSATAAGPDAQSLMETTLPLTLMPAAATLLSQRDSQWQTAVVQTLTASIPTAAPTSETITPSVTATRKIWPTLTNTAIPYVSSGAMTIQSIEDAGDNKVRVNWDSPGSFLDGFYIVWSPGNAEPSYPNDYWYYFANGRARSVLVEVTQPGTYYYRVCEPANDGKHCINYSNAMQFTNQ